MKIIIGNLGTVRDLNDITFEYMRSVSIYWKLGRLCDRFEEFPERHEGGL